MEKMSPLEQAQVLRRLQGELRSALMAADDAKQVATAAQKREAGNRRRAAVLQQEIDALAEVRTGVIVSEHALLRWLERVDGVDLEALRLRILSGTTASSIEFAGTGTVQKEGHTLVFKDRVIVTVKTK